MFCVVKDVTWCHCELSMIPPTFILLNFIAPITLGDWLTFWCFTRSCHWLNPTVSQPSLVFWLFRWKHVHSVFGKTQLIHTLVPHWVYYQADWSLKGDSRHPKIFWVVNVLGLPEWSTSDVLLTLVSAYEFWSSRVRVPLKLFHSEFISSVRWILFFGIILYRTVTNPTDLRWSRPPSGLFPLLEVKFATVCVPPFRQGLRGFLLAPCC